MFGLTGLTMTPTGVEFPPQADSIAEAATNSAVAPNLNILLRISFTLSTEFAARPGYLRLRRLRSSLRFPRANS
jgi:hypothetical protein